eukprot:2219739-Prymnesium_polylepis.1
MGGGVLEREAARRKLADLRGRQPFPLLPPAAQLQRREALLLLGLHLHDLQVLDLDDGERHALPPLGPRVRHPTFHPQRTAPHALLRPLSREFDLALGVAGLPGRPRLPRAGGERAAGGG